jgi:hypothetical protein
VPTQKALRAAKITPRSPEEREEKCPFGQTGMSDTLGSEHCVSKSSSILERDDMSEKIREAIKLPEDMALGRRPIHFTNELEHRDITPICNRGAPTLTGLPGSAA